MSLSYICEFNLNLTGEPAERYVTKILRQWPALYSELKGVQGTLLLANAFALGGPYTYLWRVDLTSYETLQVIDDALKSPDRRWRTARSDWFKNRSAVRARLLNVDGKDEGYLRSASNTEGLIHFTLAYGSSGTTTRQDSSIKENLVKSFGASKSIHRVQHFTPLIQPNGETSAGEVWVRLANLKALDGLSQAQSQTVTPLLNGRRAVTGLFGELREVDGALIAGA